MRNGYILLHRQSITPDEWKNPRRTLVWVDLLTFVDHETLIVTVSYGFLATRWRVSKNTSHLWIQQWITERRIERCTERSAERNAERFFVVNYAKYQKTEERFTERQTERGTERKTEQRYTVSSTPSKEHHEGYVRENAQTPSGQNESFFSDETIQQKAIEFFTSKGAGADHVRAEIAKFISYWTEPNKSGTKVRWQMQKTFDVKRRLLTWLNNSLKYNPSRSHSTPQI